MKHTDYFKSLLYPNRVGSLLVPLLSLGPALCAIVLTIMKYNYNVHINRFTTLLTRLNNFILLAFLISFPIYLTGLTTGAFFRVKKIITEFDLQIFYIK